MDKDLKKYDFLYHVEDYFNIPLDGRFQYDDLYLEEEWEFKDFFQKCTTEVLIEYILIIFLDKYPDYLGFAYCLNDDLVDVEKNKSISEEIKRKDIASIEWTTFEESFFNDELQVDDSKHHLVEMKMEFNISIYKYLNKIETLLEEKVFVKTEEQGNTVFDIEESPIAQLTITNKELIIKINEELVIQY